jgi:hypothetical protein
MYAEQQGVTFSLKDTAHGKVISTSSSSSFTRKLTSGKYLIQVSHATTHARKSASHLPPRTQLSIVVADPDVQNYHNRTLAEHTKTCDSGSNFPLALRQHKQTDIH